MSAPSNEKQGRALRKDGESSLGEGPVYGAVPVRACGDLRFSAGHFRILSLVSAHDRMSVKRASAGCFAAHARLAGLAGMHVKSVSRLISDLVEWGYLERSSNQINKRLAVYRVVFCGADAVAFRGSGRTHTKPSRPRSVTSEVTDHLPASVTEEVTNAPRSVTPAAEKFERKQLVPSSNIFLEEDSKKFGEAVGSADDENAAAAEEVDRAKRAAKAFDAGEIEQRDALDVIQKTVARLRNGGDLVASRSVEAIAAAVADDGLRRRPLDLAARPSAALIAWRDRQLRGAA